MSPISYTSSSSSYTSSIFTSNPYHHSNTHTSTTTTMMDLTNTFTPFIPSIPTTTFFDTPARHLRLSRLKLHAEMKRSWPSRHRKAELPTIGQCQVGEEARTTEWDRTTEWGVNNLCANENENVVTKASESKTSNEATKTARTNEEESNADANRRIQAATSTNTNTKNTTTKVTNITRTIHTPSTSTSTSPFSSASSSSPTSPTTPTNGHAPTTTTTTHAATLIRTNKTTLPSCTRPFVKDLKIHGSKGKHSPIWYRERRKRLRAGLKVIIEDLEGEKREEAEEDDSTTLRGNTTPVDSVCSGKSNKKPNLSATKANGKFSGKGLLCQHYNNNNDNDKGSRKHKAETKISTKEVTRKGGAEIKQRAKSVTKWIGREYMACARRVVRRDCGGRECCAR